MLYLGLLLAQGKHTNALAALRGELGAAAIDIAAERREAEAALLCAVGESAAAAQLYTAALTEQPDDWASLLLALDCLLPSTAAGGTPAVACVDVAASLVSGQPGAAATAGAAGVGHAQQALSVLSTGGEGREAEGCPYTGKCLGTLPCVQGSASAHSHVPGVVVVVVVVVGCRDD